MPITIRTQSSTQWETHYTDQYSAQPFFTIQNLTSGRSPHAHSSDSLSQPRSSLDAVHSDPASADSSTRKSDVTDFQPAYVPLDDDILDDDPDGYPEEQYISSAAAWPALPQEAPQGNSSEEEDDDGAMLARLMKRAEGLRDGCQNEPVEQVPSQTRPRALPDDCNTSTKPLQHIGSRTEEERKTLAVEYLESLVLDLLDQIHRSYAVLNAREADKQAKNMKFKLSKRKKLDSGESSLSQGRSQSQDRTQCQTLSANRAKGSVGLVVKTRNRKTGMDQVINWPEDPASFDPEEKDTAMVKISRVFRVASLLHEAVLDGTTITKRDIYYHDVRLFKKQSVVDKIIDDLIASAGLKRADFNVCASSKGLVASTALRIFLKTGEGLSMSATLSTLIPPAERIERVELREALDWVLVVEKDAVFNTLLASRVLDVEGIGHGVLITGKGYPDLATIQLVSRLADAFPNAAIHALVDADPYGIDILSTYTLGSQATKHSHDYTDLALGARLNWMGVKIGALAEMGVANDHLLPLTERDVAKAMSMLSRPGVPVSWKRELCEMLHLNRKAEIEILHAGEAALEVELGENGMSGLMRYVVKRLARQ